MEPHLTDHSVAEVAFFDSLVDRVAEDHGTVQGDGRKSHVRLAQLQGRRQPEGGQREYLLDDLDAALVDLHVGLVGDYYVNPFEPLLELSFVSVAVESLRGGNRNASGLELAPTHDSDLFPHFGFQRFAPGAPTRRR